MELPSSNTPPEGSETLTQSDQSDVSQSDVSQSDVSQSDVSQSDKDAVLRKRILIGIAIAGSVLLLMGIRGPIAIAPKSKEAEWADFAQLVGEEAEILARNQGVGSDHDRSDEFEEFAEEERTREQVAEANRDAGEKTASKKTASKADAETSKTSAAFDSKSKLPLTICYEQDCQLKAQKGFLSFNKMTPENFDGWFSRDKYLLAIRSITDQRNIETRVTRVKADIAEYARLKKKSANESKLDGLRTQILKGWLSLPVIPPRMSLRASEKGVLGTLTARDEVMEIAGVNDGSILVKNTAVMPYSKSKPERELYWISGIDTSELVAGQRFRPQAVFQCVGTKSTKAFGETNRDFKKFDAVDFAALAKQAIEKSSLLK